MGRNEQLAAVVWDALTDDRRSAIADELADVIARAGAAYREQFPGSVVDWTGNYVSEWVTRAGSRTVTRECLICREVLEHFHLARIPAGFAVEPHPWQRHEPEHGERCAAGLVANLMRPVAVRRRCQAIPIDPLRVMPELDPGCGDASWCGPVHVYGVGFGKRPVAVYFGDERAALVRVVSDRELIVQPPDHGTREAWVPVRVVFDGKRSVTLRRQFYYYWRPY